MARPQGISKVPALVLFDNVTRAASLDLRMASRHLKTQLQGLLADYATPGRDGSVRPRPVDSAVLEELPGNRAVACCNAGQSSGMAFCHAFEGLSARTAILFYRGRGQGGAQGSVWRRVIPIPNRGRSSSHSRTP